jgi:hypothetical protein
VRAKMSLLTSQICAAGDDCKSTNYLRSSKEEMGKDYQTRIESASEEGISEGLFSSLRGKV